MDLDARGTRRPSEHEIWSRFGIHVAHNFRQASILLSSGERMLLREVEYMRSRVRAGGLVLGTHLAQSAEESDLWAFQAHTSKCSDVGERASISIQS